MRQNVSKVSPVTPQRTPRRGDFPEAAHEFVPLYKSSKDEITTMYPMTDVEKIGLLKMDFLALTTLTVIDDTLKALKQQKASRSTWIRSRSMTRRLQAVFRRSDERRLPV
jgi:DNA polymerase III alpha subunit